MGRIQRYGTRIWRSEMPIDRLGPGGACMVSIVHVRGVHATHTPAQHIPKCTTKMTCPLSTHNSLENRWSQTRQTIHHWIARDARRPMVFGFGGLRPTALELWVANGHIPPEKIDWSSGAIMGVYDPLNPQCTRYWGLCPPNIPQGWCWTGHLVYDPPSCIRYRHRSFTLYFLDR